MESEVSQEIWQVDANGSTFEVPFDEMTTWIDDGSLLRIDRVRRGNLRWIEAGKVPALLEFFNAKDNREPLPPVITTTKKEVLGVPSASPESYVTTTTTKSLNTGDNCALHADGPAKYTCETCANLFCEACPTSYGSTVKICPFCGAMCSAIAVNEPTKSQVVRTRTANGE